VDNNISKIACHFVSHEGSTEEKLYELESNMTEVRTTSEEIKTWQIISKDNKVRLDKYYIEVNSIKEIIGMYGSNWQLEFVITC
jgi:hypothetical protein